jgi:hypothetical protein
MAFSDYLGEFRDLVEEIEAQLAAIEAGDLIVAERQEAEMRRILRELQAGVAYKKTGGSLRVDFQSAKTRTARNKALRDMLRWQQITLAAFRATDPEGYLTSERSLAEMRSLFDLAVRRTGLLFDRLAQPARFSAAQIAEAKRLAAELREVKRVYGDTLREGFFGDLIDEAEFGKIENLAAGIGAGVREPRNFLARWTAGSPLGLAGVLFTAQEATQDDLSNLITTWKLNRNQIALSSTAHVRGLINTVLIRLPQALGVSHFMFWIARRNRAAAKGLSADELYQIRLGEPDGSHIPAASFRERVAVTLGVEPESLPASREALIRVLQDAETIATWPEMFARQNDRRVSTVPWASNLTIHHGSKEWFLPIPPTLLAQARDFSASRRMARAA